MFILGLAWDEPEIFWDECGILGLREELPPICETLAAGDKVGVL